MKGTTYLVLAVLGLYLNLFVNLVRMLWCGLLGLLGVSYGVKGLSSGGETEEEKRPIVAKV